MQRREQSKAAGLPSLGLPEAEDWAQARQRLALRRCENTTQTKSTFIGKWENHWGRKSRQGSQERRCVTSVTTMGASIYCAGKFWEPALTHSENRLSHTSVTLQDRSSWDVSAPASLSLWGRATQEPNWPNLFFFFFLACLHKPWCRRLPWTKMPRDWQTGSPLGSKSQEIQVALLQHLPQ